MRGQDFTLPGLNLEMIWVEPGRFSMGGGNGEFDGQPVTNVTLTKGFWLGKYELTQSQYNAIMHAGTHGPYNLPAQYVSWDDAMEFGRKLSEIVKSAGRLPEGYAFSLPTEAQWEYACRAGTTGEFAGDIDEMAWYGGKASLGDPLFELDAPAAKASGTSPHGFQPVGQKKPNPWGFYDMHGNAQEWCLDWYASKLPGGDVTDPTGPPAGKGRVERGGTWFQPASQCSSATRRAASPFHRTGEGMRIGLVPVSSQ
jgi:formylglycine-generating enzyme required for sulfatase activity